MKSWLWLATGIIVMSILPGVNGKAQEFPELFFIVDSSGSMQAPMEGRTKLDVAKEVLRTVAAKLPPEVRIGLAAYGHRRPNDCQDVEILIAPGTPDINLLIDKVNALQPVGRTPIARTVRQVADLLKSRPAETTIVLLSDGQETCGGNPCDEVKKLKQGKLRFIMHVVGYNIKPGEKAQLECMAEAGGGRYFAANDAAALLTALETVRKDIEEKVKKAKTQVVRRKTGLGKCRIQMPPDALRSVAGIKIKRKSDAKIIKEGALSGADSTHPLPAGDYELILQLANPNYRPPTEVVLQDIAVDGGSVTNVTLGAIALNVADGLADASISELLVREIGSGRVVVHTVVKNNDYYLFKTKPVPGGSYELVIHYYRSPAPMILASPLEVQAGRQTTVTLDTGFVMKKPPNSGDVTGWDLIPKGAEKPILIVKRGFDNQEPLWRRFIIPPGIYQVRMHIKGMSEPLTVGEAVEIRRGQTLEFDTGL